MEVAEQEVAGHGVGAGWIALALFAEPSDNVRIEAESELPLDGAIKGVAGALRQNFSVSSGMSEKSIALSGRAASFARRRLRAAVMELEESFFRTIFVRTLALLSRGLAGGNDANRLFAGAILDRVNYQQKSHGSY